MKLEALLSRGKRIRAIGFDDADHRGMERGSAVNVAGIVCAATRFEGMLWGELAKDGTDSTDVLGRMLSGSKFARQLHLILLDGITFGGCNVVDLPRLSMETDLPVVAVMRRHPDLKSFHHVVDMLPDADERRRCVQAAGEIHERDGFVFQVVGEEPDVTARVLGKLTHQGKVPEALRLAHLIGSAVALGESGCRA
ncbi:MAG: DUF99 family protein [Planctomycetota bacterium]